MSLDRLKKIIDEGSSFLVASHIDPEGDAIGASLAMTFALRSLNKKVCVYNESGTPRILGFLPGAGDVVRKIESLHGIDAVFVIDCGDMDRLGALKDRLSGLMIINIDHHATNREFGHLNFVDTAAAAAGEVVFEILQKLDVLMTPEIAMNLYTAIVVDTGSFRYASTTPRSLSIASQLLAAGVDSWEVAKNVYENFPFVRMKLLGRVLDTLETAGGGKFAFMVVTRELLAEYSATDEMTEGFVNFGRAIEGVDVAVLFKESESGVYKLSFRSKGLTDVAAIAGSLGGGGHRNASGCRLRGTLDDVRRKVIAAIEDYERNTAR